MTTENKLNKLVKLNSQNHKELSQIKLDNDCKNINQIITALLSISKRPVTKLEFLKELKKEGKKI